MKLFICILLMTWGVVIFMAGLGYSARWVVQITQDQLKGKALNSLLAGSILLTAGVISIVYNARVVFG